MYGCESWTIKKAEHRRIGAFELWCWRRLLRVPWTARQTLGRLLCCNCCQYGDSNQSPLGPCDPRPKAMARVSHSTMVSTFGWSNTECIQSVLQVVAKWVWWHYRSTRVFTSWKFSFDQFKREERKELGNKLLLHSYLYWTFQTVFLYTIWRHTA